MPIPCAKWTFKLTDHANQDLQKLNRPVYTKINNFIKNRLLKADNPRSLGKPLSGPLNRFWSYRIGDYRLVCEIFDDRLIILAIYIDHRSKVYKPSHRFKASK